MNTPSQETEFRRLAAETKALHEAVSRMVLSWAEIENSLAILLGGIIRDYSNAMASAIYFAPTSTETRIAIVAAALKMGTGGSPHFDKIETAWSSFVTAINRKKNVRNKVAHGQIVTINLFGKNHVRLTSPMFDMFRIGDSIVNRQLPGLSSNDINQSIAETQKLSSQAFILRKAVEAIYSSNEKALLEALGELTRGPQTENPLSGDQNPPTSLPPPGASQA